MTTAPNTGPQADAGASNQDVERLLQQLRSADVTLRSDAAHGLGKLADERAVPSLGEALHDSDEYVRKSAVMALRRIGGPKSMEAMRVALADRSEQVCLQAVKGLGELRDAGAVEALIKVLARRERSLVQAATEALSRIGPEAVPPLMEAFKDRYLRRRIGAQIWRILTEMGSRAIDPLVGVLADDNYYVRLSALTILGRIGDKRVVESILRVFLSDPRLQETVVGTIGRLEERGVLVLPTGDREVVLPVEVVHSFAQQPRDAVLEVLNAAMENPSVKVRRFSLKVLYQLLGEATFEHLLRYLGDDDPDVKRLVIRLLSKLRDKRVIEPLLGLLLKDGGQVEEAVWDALKVLTNLHEYEELRKRVAREKAGTRPVVKTYKKKDVSPDWWRDQD
ncbi:MAG TPA: HEAT repeat domain-containing protein [bacterium]|nr:HEAT repeat domain-containing protein [bacterium]